MAEGSGALAVVVVVDVRLAWGQRYIFFKGLKFPLPETVLRIRIKIKMKRIRNTGQKGHPFFFVHFFEEL